MKADLHIHTECSCDSEAKMSDYILEAKKKGMNWLCFTDHVDLNENDYGCGYYSHEVFFENLRQLRKSESSIKICAGIEFSEPHLYAKQLEELLQLPYDFILGSIHWVGDMFPCQKVKEQYSAKEFYTLYWKEVLATVKHGKFDCLGHIDFPKRYYGEIYYQENILNEIFKTMLENDIILEINTSSMRKGLSEPMPGKELLQMYKQNGGKYVTIGSDAHEVQDLGADNQVAKELIKELLLQEVVYENRKRILVADE